MARAAPGHLSEAGSSAAGERATEPTSAERAVAVAYAVAAVVMAATIGWRLVRELASSVSASVEGRNPGWLDGEPAFYVIVLGSLLLVQVALPVTAWLVWHGRRAGLVLAAVALAASTAPLAVNGFLAPVLLVPWLAQAVAVGVLVVARRRRTRR